MQEEEFQPPLDRRRTQAVRAARRRRVALVALAAGLAAFTLGAVIGASGDDGDDTAATEKTAGPTELPRGGRSLLPEYRLVGLYGAPQDEALGALGIGTPEEASDRLLKQAKAYEQGGREIMPVFELLATVADASPGEDGLYRTRQPHSVIREYLKEARRNKGILLLDIQPGRADFADEVRRLGRYLDEPDVGLALDPEWHVGPDEVPGDVIGSVTATEVNAITDGLSETVERLGLPEKLFVIHQFTDEMITSKQLLEPREGVATVLNVDGFGDAPNKIAKYDELAPRRQSGFGSGFKLFYLEDLGLMPPADVLSLKPPPDLIVYE